MRIALCTQDGVMYQADNFNQTVDIETKKRFLVCPRCNGPAFYRGPTRNGREACFGARPHAQGCDLATVEHDGTTTGQGIGEDEVFTTGQRIVLDFNFGAPQATPDGQPAATTTTNCNAGAAGGTGTAQRETMTRRMSSLLRSLIESEEFTRSVQTIEVAGHGELTVADLFVKFSDVIDDHIGSYHGFWGMITDAQRDDRGTLWFNSGGRENLSVLLDRCHIEEAYQRFRIEDEEDIAGAYILVLGKLKVSRANGKRYVQITDPSKFTLRVVR